MSRIAIIFTDCCPTMNRTTRYIAYFIGALLIAGAFFPSQWAVFFARAPRTSNLLGLLVFKIGLVTLGGIAIVFPRFPVWFPVQSVKPRHSDKISPVFPLILLLIALTLRLYGLSYGLWYDEILTYQNYARLSPGAIMATYDLQNQHVLYSLLASVCFRLFGESAWALRLPAVFFGVASILALYLFGRTLVKTREALLAAALLTFSYHHIWFSQNARGYIGLLFWTILASHLLMRGIREGDYRIWLAYAVASALGVYTHLTMIFIVLGHFVIYSLAVIRPKIPIVGKWRGFFLGFCLSALLTLQLYAFVLGKMLIIYLGVTFSGEGEAMKYPTFSGQGEAMKYPIAFWKNPLWAVSELIELLQLQFVGSLLAVIIAFSVFSVGFVGFARKKPVLIQLFFFPVAICLAAIIAQGYYLWPRIFFFATGFGALILIHGAVILGNKFAGFLRLDAKKTSLVEIAFATALVLASAITIPAVYGPKQDFQGALSFVEKAKKDGDSVLAVGMARDVYDGFYRTNWPAPESASELEDICRHARRTWLLYTITPQLEYLDPEIMKIICRDFILIKAFPGTLRGGTVYVCRNRQGGENDD